MSTATLTPTKTALLDAAGRMLAKRLELDDDGWFDGRQLCDFIWLNDGDDRTLSGIVQHLHWLAEAGYLESEGGGRQGKPVRFRIREKGAA